jgi:uncharacterized protein (TIGR00251 family)
MSGEARPWTAREKGVVLQVRLTPKSSRDALEGVEVLADGACVLKARVRAVPEDGKANDALVALVAKSLKTPASRIKIASGATSRHKSLLLEGEPAEIFARLETLVASPKP